MRKSLSIIVAALATISTFAATAHAEAPNGPRAEVIVGWDHLNGGSRLDDDGVTYGLGLGYDYAISDRSALGIDTEISDSDGKQSNLLADDITTSYSAKRDLYVGARYTYSASDRVNLFATAGYTNQRIHGESSLAQSGSDNLDGVRVGAGVQYNLTDNIYWTTAYRHSNYEAGLDRSQVVTGIGYRF